CAVHGRCLRAPCRSPCTFTPPLRNCRPRARVFYSVRRGGKSFATGSSTRQRSCGTRLAPCSPPATRSSITKSRNVVSRHPSALSTPFRPQDPSHDRSHHPRHPCPHRSGCVHHYL